MREMGVYRGRAIHGGEWLYGNLLAWETHAQIWVPNENGEKRNYEVDPATVGEFTGLRDKNACMVYGGSLCKDADGDIFEVFYNTAHCAFMTRYENPKYAAKKRGYFKLGDYRSFEIEVIGTIHDAREGAGG